MELSTILLAIFLGLMLWFLGGLVFVTVVVGIILFIAFLINVYEEFKRKRVDKKKIGVGSDH